MKPENDRGRPAPGDLRKSPSRHASDKDQDNPWGTSPVAVDRAGIAVLELKLAEIIGHGLPVSTWARMDDPERLALAFVDTCGPRWARRLADALLCVADEVRP